MDAVLIVIIVACALAYIFRVFYKGWKKSGECGGDCMCAGCSVCGSCKK